MVVVLRDLSSDVVLHAGAGPIITVFRMFGA